MPTDQRRYQVFVSSTYLDLREARQAVTMTLLECDAFPTGMEIFPATDDDAWTIIKQVIDESDYYLLVIAGKYGSVDEASGLSYTEMEYDYAVSVGKPVMAFIHGEPNKLLAEQVDSKEDAQAKLAAFRDKVEKAKHVKFWMSPESLAGQVSLTYNKFQKLYPAVGWIRADQATSSESLRELLDAKTRVEQLEKALTNVRTAAPEGTEELAQGDDYFMLPFYASAKYTNPADKYSVSSADGWTRQKTTWNAMFGSISPQLLQEAEESALHEGIQDFILGDFPDEIADVVLKLAKESGHDIDRESLHTLEATVHNDDFGTILVQLMALGLIRRSDRKRSVNDTGTYWALTPYGENRTIQLRALRKSDVDAPDREADNDALGGDEED